MYLPFEIDSERNSLEKEYKIRVNNVFDDIKSLESGVKFIYVLDTYFLFTFFLKKSDDIEILLSNKIYSDKSVNKGFVILPETIREIYLNINKVLNNFKRENNKCISRMSDFLNNKLVRKFRAVMQEIVDLEKKDKWPVAQSLLEQIFEDNELKNYLLTLIRYSRILDFKELFNAIRKNVLNKKIFTYGKLKKKYSALNVTETQDTFRSSNYKTLLKYLEKQRSKDFSNITDASVFSKTVEMNRISTQRKQNIKFNFLTHERMVDLINLGLNRDNCNKNIPVRSFTDISMLIAGYAKSYIIKKIRIIDDLITNSKESMQPSDKCLWEAKLTNQIKSVRDDVIKEFKFSEVTSEKDLAFLLEMQARNIYKDIQKNLNRNEIEGKSIAEVDNYYKNEITRIYSLINNLTEKDADDCKWKDRFDKFMEPLYEENRNLLDEQTEIMEEEEISRIEEIIKREIDSIKDKESAQRLAAEIRDDFNYINIKIISEYLFSKISTKEQNIQHILIDFAGELKKIEKDCLGNPKNRILRKCLDNFFSGIQSERVKIEDIVLSEEGKKRRLLKDYAIKLIERSMKHGFNNHDYVRELKEWLLTIQ